ncbi:MAG: hypothetical protein IKR72_02820 [Bacteroidales bacterium]|nr:hypothetical protein [Bacteroidales bacterium]
MKFLKLFIPALALAALFSGCTKEYITNEYYQGAKVYARDYTIKPSDWTVNYPDGDEIAREDNFFWAEFDNPDITKNVVENGTVQAFIYTLYNNLGSWNPLPYVYPLYIEKTDKTTGDVLESYIVSENTRFDYRYDEEDKVGKVTFTIQDLDGINPVDIINDMSIKVCVTI